MERLTNKREADAQREEYERRLANGYPRNIPEERFLRLAAYEDTHMMPADVMSMRMDMAIITALLHDCDVDRMRELAEADKEGRLFLLPLEPGRSMLCPEHFERPWVMKNVTPCVQYQSSAGIVFYMGYDVFRSLVEHGKITPLSPEGEKALEAMEDE
ncbi:MAG: hypothetical protein ACLUVL_03490 [Oscillospiraceae bacterium]